MAGALSDLLGRHRFGVVRAEGAARALALLGDAVDLLLLDLVPPGGAAFALLEVLAEAPDAREQPLGKPSHASHVGGV